MRDEDKNKAQLIDELVALRRRVDEREKGAVRGEAHDPPETEAESRAAELEAANRRLKQEIADRKRAEDRITSLNRLREELLGLGTVSEKLKCVTDGVVDTFGADFVRIWVIKPGDACDSGCVHAEVTAGPHVCRHRDRCLHLTASSGRYTHLDGRVHCRVPFGCYKIGRVAAGGEAKFITNDVTRDPRVHDHDWARGLGLVSFAGYRLLSPAGEPMGVLALFGQQAITPDEDALLEGLAHTASQVVQTAAAEETLYTNSQILSSLQDTIIVISPGMKTIYANQTAKDLFGDGPEMFTEPCYRFFKRLDEVCEDCPVIEVFKDERPHKVISKSYDKHGGEMWRYNTAFPYYDRDGGLVGAIEIVTDYTDQRTAEEALRASEERYRTLVEESFDGIFVQKGTKITFANHRLHEMLGYGPGELIGLEHWQVYHPDDRDLTRRRAQARMRGESVPSRYEVKMMRQDGTSFDGGISARAVTFDHEPGVQVWVRDISEPKRAEKEREGLIAELQEALENVKTLRGLVPICSSCKKIRDDEGYWHQVEVYVRRYSEAEFSHGICPECRAKLYPDLGKK